MNIKNIKSIQFICGESGTTIYIPIECFEEMSICCNVENNILTNLDCTIEDNGAITGEWRDNMMSPLDIIYREDNIKSIRILDIDGNISHFDVNWYDNDPENGYEIPQENKNQTSKMLDYRTLHIKIEPYIQKYSLNELFDFDEGTKFKDEDDNLYYIHKGIVMKIDEDKDIPIYITKDILNKEYTLEEK